MSGEKIIGIRRGQAPSQEKELDFDKLLAQMKPAEQNARAQDNALVTALGEEIETQLGDSPVVLRQAL